MHIDSGSYPIGLTAVPSHFAKQSAAANRLAPAEAYRGHSALLISRRGHGDRSRAEQALVGRWGLDAVHHVALPIRQWSDVSGDEGKDSWLRAYVLRAIDRHDPSIVAILDDPDSLEADEGTVAKLPEVLHRWGAALPVAVLRTRPDSEVEWLSAPMIALRDCG